VKGAGCRVQGVEGVGCKGSDHRVKASSVAGAEYGRLGSAHRRAPLNSRFKGPSMTCFEISKDEKVRVGGSTQPSVGGGFDTTSIPAASPPMISREATAKVDFPT